ncbi:universal stress protein [Pseudomonas sp.]|uniref:universal stress protein n=1 Tax=Pseudomonas sp. TaxID=306 RepID=UPI0028AC2B95|nr:universal stress protein [Pseudomonas sp.]
MQAIRSILVVIQPDQTGDLALKRARLIAGVTQSHLHLLVCDNKRQHTIYLNELVGELERDGYRATAQQAWQENLHQTVINVQQAEGCGLVIKQQVPENALKRLLLTPEDWKLLRHCPAPVLMVKTDRLWTGGKVLAAVDVGNADGEHRTLHASIISHAYDIAGLASGSLHVVSAHPAAMLASADPTFQLSETIEARYRDACKAFQADYEIPGERLHICEGPADVVIPQVASRLNAVVTVLGTVARSGFSGALIGNTAEVVLDALDSDVLVLKPDDIIDHLEELVAQR